MVEIECDGRRFDAFGLVLLIDREGRLISLCHSWGSDWQSKINTVHIKIQETG